jgi:hypothetical protein
LAPTVGLEPTTIAGSSSAAEATQTAPIAQSIEEAIVVPKVPIAEPVEAKVDKAEESKIEEIIKVPKIMSLQQRQNCRRCKRLLSQLPR